MFRSACFYYLGDIESCLQDIELALSCGYPEQLRYKLHERRAKCHLLLGQFDLAKTALTSAKKSFEAHKAKFEEKKAAGTVASLREIQAAISSRAQLPGESVTVEERQVPVVPKLTGGANKKMRSLSSRVKV